jgi:uncharacterized protein YkwD
MRGLFWLACATLAGCLGSVHQPGDMGGGGGGGGTAPTAEAQRNLDEVNRYRAILGRKPLAYSVKLSEFATRASDALAAGGAPHAYFSAASNSGTLFSSGFCNGAGENQAPGWPAGNLPDTVDAVLKAMMDEGPGGGHHDAIVSPSYGLLGVGLVVKNGQLYFTNDFSPPCS